MDTITCYRCSNTFLGYGGLCTNCQQTEALKKEQEKSRELQEKIHSENIALQRRIAQEAENARQQAYYLSEQNSRREAESQVSSDDAYGFGANYINLDFGNDNSFNLEIFVGEDGDLWANWTEPYLLPHLNNSFKAGLLSSLGNYSSPGRKYIEEMAYAAGYQISTGKLNSEAFNLGANGLIINGIQITTKNYCVNLIRELNESNGFITYKYNMPFNDEMLNEEFSKGINAGTEEMNSEELKNLRLSLEVPEIQKNRKQESLQKFISIVWIIFSVLAPFIGWYLGWQYTTGWNCFFTIVLWVPIISFLNLVLYIVCFQNTKFNYFK